MSARRRRMPDAERLRAASEAATPGEWHRLTHGTYDQRHAAAQAFLSVMATRAPDNAAIQYSDLTFILTEDGKANVAMVGNGPRSVENAELIVAAVNYVRAILAETTA